MAVKISKKAITKYKLRVEGSSVWMETSIESWNEGGTLDIQSDYGNYAYRWGSTGFEDFREFLCKIDQGYLMGKLDHTNQYIFDEVATSKQMALEVIEARKANRKDSPEAYRKIFNIVKDIPKNVGSTRSLYDYLQDRLPRVHCYCTESKEIVDGIISECGLGDFSCLSIQTMTNPIHTKFWNELWVPLKDYWKKEMEDERVAAK